MAELHVGAQIVAPSAHLCSKMKPMQPPRRPGTQTAEQVADRFGVAVKTIYRWRREGRIRAIKVGNYYVFADTEVDRFDNDRFAGLDLTDSVAS